MAVKFPLEMKNGVMARNMSEVKENFDTEKIVSHFLEGKLLTWLEARYYEGEAEAISVLSIEDPELAKKLCEIFGVEYEEENAVNAEEIAKRNAKIVKLKQYTDDESIIANIDLVAFDQEELADIYDTGAEKIYLCAGEFNIPKSKQDLEYIELGNAVVTGKQKGVAAEVASSGTRTHSLYNSVEENSYVLYYTTSEYTNGHYPIVEKLIGYDEKKRKKDVLWTASFEEKRKDNDKSICALAKSKSYLWVCYKYPNDKLEVAKMDLYGRNERIVATMQNLDWSVELWANDVNAYIKNGGNLLQIDSNNQLHDFGKLDAFCMDEVKITDSYLAVLLGDRNGRKVIICDNDAKTYEEYPYRLSGLSGGLGFGGWREKINAFGIYDGKPSFVKYNTESMVGKQNTPVLCVLQRGGNKWEEYPLPNADCFSSMSSTKGNSILSYIQMAEDKLFIRSGCTRIIGAGKNEFSVYDMKTGERSVLYEADAVFSVIYNNNITVKENCVYVQLRKGVTEGIILMSIECLNGKTNVIVKSSATGFNISTCVL